MNGTSYILKGAKKGGLVLLGKVFMAQMYKRGWYSELKWPNGEFGWGGVRRNVVCRIII